MTTGLALNREAIAHACRVHGVTRLRIFGSGTGNRFDPSRSDIDLLVEFESTTPHPFDAYFGLKEDLEGMFGREVDLIMADAMRNPHFASSALAGAEELYAA